MPSVENATVIAPTSIRYGHAENLSEDKKRWSPPTTAGPGKRYTAAPSRRWHHEAVVYSNVGDPTPGASSRSRTRFQRDSVNEACAGCNCRNDYTELPRSRFDQSAGTSRDLPENTVAVRIPGAMHGVAGTYSCEPGAGNKCASQVAATGFTLDTVNIPTDGSQRRRLPQKAVPGRSSRATRMPGAMARRHAICASYGWWIHKSADGATFTEPRIRCEHGYGPASRQHRHLAWERRPMGGAVGKYALRGSTGGTNDAGHFTAEQRLRPISMATRSRAPSTTSWDATTVSR